MKILIVEDDRDICEILEFNLSNEGFEVEIAYSAEEAMEMRSCPCLHKTQIKYFLVRRSSKLFGKKLHISRNAPSTFTSLD